ncbi:pyridoxamine 5'-phosphate oxidase family protein [Saccharopolyspora sp. TS4A08]|uniref:Pyridoxamine 5'-phosphate oxidase family protein n=1 Tax=Saccharopolyspora ipomoeae TaxID=3042027 RepID=A0ABT6PIQ0_9PSEU|nr:pyridoxamine 5'-phosphate oxidase family protein [Saccharopolyspora sp. TS4A08]MDI2027873.1 pyridoxamine 5'-phosphate oxidase family protein [Saccharopolyspora sp. TS4A08]
MELEGAQEITSTDELEEVVGRPLQRVLDKQRPALHQLDVDWLAASPFCLVATSDEQGRCDVSPKGDPAGFTLVLDERTIAIPERPGNRRVDGFRNVLANPHVGLVYLIPGRGDTLRINGRARLLRDAPFFDRMVVRGHRPSVVLLVEIEEVFHHCSKAFLRSGLWNAETWNPEAVPSSARLAKNLTRPNDPIDELERYYSDERFRSILYDAEA